MITHGRQNIGWLSIGGKMVDFLSRGRYNLSVTPYSGQATAALKAQFPTQWPTIRDYGFAHPALVPFINEDPMLICSVGLQSQGVDLPIRWLVGDGASWIDSGYNVKSNTWFKGRFITTRIDAARISGALILNGSNASIQIGNTSGLKLYSGFGTLVQGSDIVVNRVYDFEITNTRASIIWDGGSFIHSYSAISVTNNVSLTMFARNITNGNVDCLCYWNSPFFEYGDNSESHKVVPFVSPTRNGMLDIANLANPVFHPNQGTGAFTAQLTEADGVTPWTPAS